MQKQAEYFTMGTENKNVAVSADIMQSFRDVQQKSTFKKETGGILAGYYDAGISGLLISDITSQQSEDYSDYSHFIRSSKGHQLIMDELWEQSNHRKSYLGEWHTHNQDKPMPSCTDINNWKKIACSTHNFDELFFVIVGISYVGFWVVENKKIDRLGYL